MKKYYIAVLIFSVSVMLVLITILVNVKSPTYLTEAEVKSELMIK